MIKIENENVFYNDKILKRGDKYIIICQICHKQQTKRFYSFKEFSYLCSSCKRKQLMLEKYGVENISQLDKTKEKIKQNNLIKYGVESHNQLKKIKEKKKQSYLNKYGVDNPSKNENIKNKIKKTKLEKYNNENYNNSEQAKKTNLQKYGVTSLLSKNKDYMYSKYGVTNSSYLENSRNKREETILKKYGVKNAMQNDEIRERVRNSSFKNVYNKILNLKIILPLFTLEEYKQTRIHQYSKFKWKCLKCGTEFEDYYANGIIPRCPVCYPKINNISVQEKEIVDFIKSLGINNIIENSRSIIPPQELDIYLPDYKLAIEYNGLYWHSELQGKDKNYHLNKTIECEKQGIRLLHIFEDEWIDKSNIIKNIIKIKLGLVDNKIGARKCVLKEVDNQRQFLEENHIQGYIPAKINIGLYYQNELVSLLTFGRSRFNKQYNWEILRYVSKNGYSIFGGFNKMLKYFINNYLGSIITYSDRRLFNGKIYENYFVKSEPSKPNYYYTNYNNRYTRIKFQKHKLSSLLKNFSPNLTEWENMQLNGWDKIYDCGNNLYVFNKKQ